MRARCTIILLNDGCELMSNSGAAEGLGLPISSTKTRNNLSNEHQTPSDVLDGKNITEIIKVFTFVGSYINNQGIVGR